MRTIATIALALSFSFALIPAPRAHACGGTYSRSPEDYVASAAYAYLLQQETPGPDVTWSVEEVSISEGTAHTVVRWNGRIHTLSLVARADGAWDVTRWRARPLPAAGVTPAS